MKLPSTKFLSDGEFRGIGIVAVEWSYMEFTLQVSIWRLLDVDTHTGMVITGDMTAGQLMNLIKPLARRICRFKPVYPELEKLLGDIDHLLSERNKVIHLMHVDNDDEKFAFRIKRTPEIQKHERYSEVQIIGIAEKIYAARRQLSRTKLPSAGPMSPELLKALEQLGDGETP